MQRKPVKLDVSENIRLMEFAASQDISIDVFGHKFPNIGVVEAEHSLGLAYQDGVGVLRDVQKAFDYYTRGIKHGYGASANNIGFMYNAGCAKGSRLL